MCRKRAGKIGSGIGRIRGMWMGRLVTLLAVLWSLPAAEAGALEFTADQITKINGRTQKSNIFYLSLIHI